MLSCVHKGNFKEVRSWLNLRVQNRLALRDRGKKSPFEKGGFRGIWFFTVNAAATKLPG
jgi:hypothetical protein